MKPIGLKMTESLVQGKLARRVRWGGCRNVRSERIEARCVLTQSLQERRDAYRIAGISLGFAQQCAELPGCKQVCPDLAEVNSQVVQDAVKRVDLAFAAFFRRCQVGEHPGYPRFRSRLRYDSLTFKQFGNSFSLVSESKQRGKLILSKIGHVKMVMHRPIKGKPKTAIVKRTPTGKWYVSICCTEVEPIPLPTSSEQVGIDVGLKTFAYLSTDEHIDNPRFFREEEKHLAKAQRRLSKAASNTCEKKKRRKVVARTHERISNRRQNFIQQQVALLVKRFGLIAVEALVVRNMVKNPKLAKSIADAAWSAFFTQLVLKAEEAARQVVKVNPAYTSQTCSACGHRQEMPLSVRVYECSNCGLVMDRDHNASRTILAQAVGRHGHVVQEASGLEPRGVVTKKMIDWEYGREILHIHLRTYAGGQHHAPPSSTILSHEGSIPQGPGACYVSVLPSMPQATGGDRHV